MHVPRQVLRSGPYYAKGGREDGIQWKKPKTLAHGLERSKAVLNKLAVVATGVQQEDGVDFMDEETGFHGIEQDDYVSPISLAYHTQA